VSENNAGCPLTPAIGRGNEIVCFAANEVAKRIVGMDVEEIFADMGAFYSFRE
jgi:L-fuconate dehydratase